jgi:hypothetical protein
LAVCRIQHAEDYPENQCPSPNHLKIWWREWRELPDSDLKTKHLLTLRNCLPSLNSRSAQCTWAETFASELAAALSDSNMHPDEIARLVGTRPAPLGMLPPSGRATGSPTSLARKNDQRLTTSSESAGEPVLDGRTSRGRSASLRPALSANEGDGLARTRSGSGEIERESLSLSGSGSSAHACANVVSENRNDSDDSRESIRGNVNSSTVTTRVTTSEGSSHSTGTPTERSTESAQPTAAKDKYGQGHISVASSEWPIAQWEAWGQMSRGRLLDRYEYFKQKPICRAWYGPGGPLHNFDPDAFVERCHLQVRAHGVRGPREVAGVGSTESVGLVPAGDNGGDAAPGHPSSVDIGVG